MRDSIFGSVSITGLSRDSLTGRALGERSVRDVAMAGMSLQSFFSENSDEDAQAPSHDKVPTREDGTEIGIGIDICIRVLGLAAIALSFAIIRWLHADVQRHPVPEAPLWQLAFLAVAFLSASVGCGLAALGRHIHDRIEVAERWRRWF